jgi:hypothetical protein
MMAHDYNTSYLGGRGRRIMGEKKKKDPISKITNAKRAGREWHKW